MQCCPPPLIGTLPAAAQHKIHLSYGINVTHRVHVTTVLIISDTTGIIIVSLLIILPSCKKLEFKTVSVDGLGSGMGKW